MSTTQQPKNTNMGASSSQFNCFVSDSYNNLSVTLGEQTKHNTPEKLQDVAKKISVSPAGKTADSPRRATSMEPRPIADVPPLPNASDPKKKRQGPRLFPVVLSQFVVLVLIGNGTLPQENWLQFSVLMYLAMVGLLSYFHAQAGLRRERNAFEENRHRELAPESLRQLFKRCPTPYLRSRDSFFTELFNKEFSDDNHDTRWHHRERPKMIVQAAFPLENGNGRVPMLDDLHELTLVAEQGRRPVRILNNITSTFLILGILGTLYGVHEALPLEANGRIELREVANALLPSAFAVIFTIILIILRSLYRHKVNLHLGRLDRHTLRFYFPLFRTDELNEQTLKELENGVTGLEGSFGRIVESIHFLEQFPSVVKDQKKQLAELAEGLDTVSRGLNWADYTPDRINQLEDKLGGQAMAYKEQCRQLRESVDALRQLLSPMETLMVEQLDRYHLYCENMKDTPQHLQMIREIASGLSSLPGKQIDTLHGGIAALLEMLSRMQQNGECIGNIQREVTQQAEKSTAVIRLVQEQSIQHQEAVTNNWRLYDKYRKSLETQHFETAEKVKNLTDTFEKQEKELKKINNNLTEQIEEYTKNSTKYWWKWLAVLLLLLLYSTNMYLALSRI